MLPVVVRGYGECPRERAVSPERVRMPEDVSAVGFDDRRLSELWSGGGGC